MMRRNLHVITDAFATRIGFLGKRANAVHFQRAGRTSSLRATREVIVAAGTVGSAHLLQVSGAGPASTLKRLDVLMREDLPATGHHLQDHLTLDYVFRTNTPTLNEALGSRSGRLIEGIRALAGKRGPLSTGLYQSGAIIQSDNKKHLFRLDFCPASFSSHALATRPRLQPDSFSGFQISISLLNPHSTGSVEIVSSDPALRPVIRPGSLTDSRDVAAMVDGAKLIRRLVEQAGLSAVTEEEVAPGHETVSDIDIESDIRARSRTGWAPVGTCRMGPDASTSVVDGRFNVHELSLTRVVDASVIPFALSGHTTATTMMMAARAADFILEENPF